MKKEKTKFMHSGAIACFLLALLFYFVSWLPGAMWLAFFGACFEIAAWVQLFGKSGKEVAK